MRIRFWLGFGLAWAVAAGAPCVAQVRVEVPAPSGEINVTYTAPADEGQAARLRDLAVRLKPRADQLYILDRIDIVIVHSVRELEQRLGPQAAGALSGVSYVHGILFLSPLSWRGNPTSEALEHEMEQALVRYAALQLAGGNRLPDWLEQGLVSVLTQRSFAITTAELVARRASLLLAQRQADDPAIGYWAVRYLTEARGGLTPLRQLLRLVAQRPDSFVENLQLVYGVPVGTLERDWRRWMNAEVEAEKKRREGGVRTGPLVKDRD
ncbi:MAG: hypothetical protein ACE5HL_01165 [Terriglobia bacterium]